MIYEHVGVWAEVVGKESIESALQGLGDGLNERDYSLQARLANKAIHWQERETREPEWRPLRPYEDGGPIRIKRRPGLERERHIIICNIPGYLFAAVAEGYEAQVMDNKDGSVSLRGSKAVKYHIVGSVLTSPFCIAVVNTDSQNEEEKYLLMVEELNLRAAFEQLRYLLEFQRADRKDPRFRAIFASKYFAP